MSTPLNIAAIAPDAAAQASMTHALQGLAEKAAITFLDAGRSTDAIAAKKLEVFDVLIVDGSRDPLAQLPMISIMTRANPRLVVLLLSGDASSDILIEAMRVGVREVLPSPVTASELRAALERANQRLASPENRAVGKVFVFVSCKGGSGATFMAANLGYALAAGHQKKVLLIDLDLQYGDATFSLNSTNPTHSVADVARQGDKLDASMLLASTMKISADYSLLAAPDDPEQAMNLEPAHIERLLALASQLYDFVIVDVERSMDAIAIKAFDKADLIFPVTQLLLPNVRDTTKLLRLFRSLGYPDSKIRLIGNRTDTNGDLPVKQVEAAIGLPLFRSIPNDHKSASASCNLGEPVLRQSPNSPISIALQELAAHLAGAQSTQDSWLGKLFRRTS
jgi:pilus assembly protein CpaE